MNSGKNVLQQEFFPQGRALRITTDSSEVLQQAEHLWGRFPRLSKADAIELAISVSAGNVGEPQAPICKVQRSRVLFRGNNSNWAIADLRRGIGRGYFTKDYLRRCAHWRYHFLEPLGYTLISARHFTLLHAATIAHNGRAVLLCGKSGAGKTSLAFAAARKRWAYVSGDASALVRGVATPRIVGRPFDIRFRASAADLFPELRQFPATLRPNGKVDYELDPTALAIPTALEVQAACVVVLERTAQGPPSLHELSREACINHFSLSLLLDDAQLRKDQMQSLETLLALPRFRLRYSSLDAAEEILWSLLEVDQRRATA